MSWANAGRRLTVVLRGAPGDGFPDRRGKALWLFLAVALASLALLVVVVGVWLTSHFLSPVASTAQLDPHIAQMLERLTREAVSKTSQSAPSWPVWVLVAVGIILVAVALVAIFKNEKSDGVTKILSGAIVSIGGVLAISKLGGAGSLTEYWSAAANSAILAILVCVGLAVARKPPGASLEGGSDGGSAIPQPVREHGRFSSASLRRAFSRVSWVGFLGGLVVVCCLAGLLGIVPLLKSYAGGCPETKPCPPAPQKTVSRTTVTQRITEVAGFPSGIADPDGENCRNIPPEEQARLLEAMKRAVDAVKRYAAEKSIESLEIYASTDRDQLQGKCRKQYTTNRQLARARGEWVGQALNASINVPYVVYEVGPTEFGVKDRALDRSVSIFGIYSRGEKTE